MFKFIEPLGINLRNRCTSLELEYLGGINFFFFYQYEFKNKLKVTEF